MLLYVLVLIASLYCLEVKSYPFNMAESRSEYEGQLEGPKSSYDQQIDEIVTEMATCMNSTLTETGIMNKLNSNNRLLVENIGISGIRNYIEYLFQYLKEKEEKEKEGSDFYDQDDREYSPEEDKEQERRHFSDQDYSEYSSEEYIHMYKIPEMIEM